MHLQLSPLVFFSSVPNAVLLVQVKKQRDAVGYRYLAEDDLIIR